MRPERFACLLCVRACVFVFFPIRSATITLRVSRSTSSLKIVCRKQGTSKKQQDNPRECRQPLQHAILDR